jgi:hypothetical protein
MNKTQDLMNKIAAGTHRISSMGYVQRKASTGEWVSCELFRRDVVLRAQVALMKSGK